MSKANRIPSQPLRWRLLCLAALFGLSACTSGTPAAVPEGPGRILTLQNTEIDEASGLVVSRTDHQRLWLHNDSGGAARLYAVDPNGQDLGQVDIRGVANTDWEDMATYTMGGAHFLLVADVGDNNGIRPAVRLHVLAEPETPNGELAPLRSLTVVYPDGPRDCEAVAVDDAALSVYLLTKRDTPPRLYRVPLNTGLPVASAEFLGTVESIPAPTADDLTDDPEFGQNRSQPTAMSFSAAGDRALIVTYKDAYLYTRSQDESWLQALNRAPRVVDLPQFAQTEAGGLNAAGDLTFVGSEQLPAALVEIALP